MSDTDWLAIYLFGGLALIIIGFTIDTIFFEPKRAKARNIRINAELAEQWRRQEQELDEFITNERKETHA